MTLVAKNLACVRAERLVFSAVNLSAGRGDLLVLRGPNGSGKSSLLRLLGGLIPAADGEVSWQGQNLTKTPEDLRLVVHYAGHLDAVKTPMTAEENLIFWAALHGASGSAGEALVASALDAFDLTALAATPVHYFSAGQKRRLGLARLLTSHRPVWLLDEPTVALDALSVERLRTVVNTYRKDGGIVLAATHIDLGMGDEQVLDLSAPGGEVAA